MEDPKWNTTIGARPGSISLGGSSTGNTTNLGGTTSADIADASGAGSGSGNQGTGLMGKLRDGANSQLNTQKDRATEGLGSVAQAVRQTTQQLRDQHHDTVAQYVEQAADQIERFSSRLRQKNVGDLVNDAQDLARRQPALFVGSAFALGLLGARFFKSSNQINRAQRLGYRGNDWRQGTSGGDYRPSLPTTGSNVAGSRLDYPGRERS